MCLHSWFLWLGGGFSSSCLPARVLTSSQEGVGFSFLLLVVCMATTGSEKVIYFLFLFPVPCNWHWLTRRDCLLVSLPKGLLLALAHFQERHDFLFLFPVAHELTGSDSQEELGSYLSSLQSETTADLQEGVSFLFLLLMVHRVANWLTERVWLLVLPLCGPWLALTYRKGLPSCFSSQQPLTGINSQEGISFLFLFLAACNWCWFRAKNWLLPFLPVACDWRWLTGRDWLLISVPSGLWLVLTNYWSISVYVYCNMII